MARVDRLTFAAAEAIQASEVEYNPVAYFRRKSLRYAGEAIDLIGLQGFLPAFKTYLGCLDVKDTAGPVERVLATYGVAYDDNKGPSVD
jgi:hypothetical protein